MAPPEEVEAETVGKVLLIHSQGDVRQHVTGTLSSSGLSLMVLDNFKDAWQTVDENAPDFVFIEKRLLKDPAAESFLRTCDTCQIPVIVLSEIRDRALLTRSIEKSLGIKSATVIGG